MPLTPGLFSAQANATPADTRATPVSADVALAITWVGTVFATSEPLPSWPLVFSPQHFTRAAVTAQENRSPAARWVTPVSPVATTGDDDDTTVPLPS